MKDLRELFDKSSYTNYSYFIRNVVKPVIGNKGLHRRSTEDRRVEYDVSLRNYVKVSKLLGLELPLDMEPARQLAEMLVKQAKTDTLVSLVTESIKRSIKVYPLEVTVPIHPFSVNDQYVPNDSGGLRRSDSYNEWREEMEVLLEDVVLPPEIDVRGKMEIELTFCHRPSFDTDNFIKSAIDALAVKLKFNDRNIRVHHVFGVESRDSEEYFIKYRLRNV